MIELSELEPKLDTATDTKLLEWIKVILPDQPGAVADFAATLDDNPGRISRAYRSLLSGYSTNPQELLKITVEVPDSGHHGLVVTKRIPFLSLCAHHFLPFFGQVDIVYEPGRYIIGIGKMPRLVDCRAKRFQLQELLVRQIAEDMANHADARGVYVRSTARHACVCYRGPEHPTTYNITTYATGSLRATERMAEVQTALASGTAGEW